MNKVQEIEALVENYELAKSEARRLRYHNQAKLIGRRIKGLKDALRILNEPSKKSEGMICPKCKSDFIRIDGCREMEFSHDDLTKIAEKWLLKRCGFAFRELTTFAGETPDAIGFRSDGSILVECKISRADFHADKKKDFRIHPWMGVGMFRFFLCPAGVILPEDLPEKWGLLYVNELNILQLIKKDPEWAANVLQNYESCIEDLEANIEDLEAKKDRLLEALQAAFRKHHCNDESIGWNELSDIMSCALPEVMGSNEFCDWLDTVGAQKD